MAKKDIAQKKSAYRADFFEHSGRCLQPERVSFLAILFLLIALLFPSIGTAPR